MKKNILTSVLSLLIISCLSSKINNMQKRSFEFYTEYHQFYIEDSSDDKKGDAASTDFWSEDAFSGRLALTNKIIGIGTQCYGNVKGEIEILTKPNNVIDYSKYDHIVEGGINIQSGEMQILNCTSRNLEMSLKLVPGTYRVRVYSSNLASVIDDDGDDYYRIEVWPSDDIERKVLKQYKNDL